MEKLKSVDLKICFDTEYSHSPLSIEYNRKLIKLDKGKTFMDLPVKSIDQVVDIKFFGFQHYDKSQEIKVDIYYEDKKIDTTSLCTFHMENNKFVINTVLENYNNIFFNGNLKIKFFQAWFECNLLAGAYINNQKRFLHRWVIDYENQNALRSVEGEEYDVYCIGCSFTFGYGLEKQHTWPELLSKKLNCSVGNFGTPGMSIHGCFRQILYCLENFSAKKIIVLLPAFHRMFYKFKFLGNNAYYNLVPTVVQNNFPFFDAKTNIENILKNGERFGRRLIKRLININHNNCKIYVTAYPDDVYDAIPDGDHKLPKYPNLKIYKERASDGSHPHYKHNKLFVDSISDRIDKI
jgi:hypothetical protein